MGSGFNLKVRISNCNNVGYQRMVHVKAAFNEGSYFPLEKLVYNVKNISLTWQLRFIPCSCTDYLNVAVLNKFECFGHESFSAALDPPFLSISNNDDLAHLYRHFNYFYNFNLQLSDLPLDKWRWFFLFQDYHFDERREAS